MKTIAVSIDEASLEAIDRMAREAAAGATKGVRAKGRRSEIVRRALREFVVREERRAREARERRVLAAHRLRLARQAEALVGEQAEP